MSKKIRLLALVMVLAVLLCSCGKEEESTGFSYSTGIDKNGFLEGITALDYVTLPDLDSLEVSDSDVDLEIYYLMNQTSYMKKVEVTDRVVADGDTLSIDYVGSIDGVAFEGGDTQGMGTEVTIGVTSYIDGFLDQLIGHKVGENFDINVTFPEDYGNEDLAGKDAVFNITINAMYDYEAYELTDNFVQGVLYDDYSVSTVEELKALVKGSLMYDAVMDGCEFKEELPSSIGEQYIARVQHEHELQAESYSMTLDEYIAAVYSSYGMSTFEDLKSYLELYVDSVAQEELMLQAIAEQEKITITDEDMEALYEEAAANYEASGLEFEKEDMISVYGEPYIKQMALFDKVQNYLATL